MKRRELLQGMGAATGLSLLPVYSQAETMSLPKGSFTYCLNMATIRGHNLGFIKELETAATAGFKGVEIWIDTLQAYLDKGGSLKEVKKRIADLGITIESCIGFAPWIIGDEGKRKEGVDQMKKEMDMLAQIGCKRTAAPPAGATEGELLDLKQVAERYKAILEVGDQTGVVPQLELWGFSKNLSRVSEVMYVALETGHPAARVLLDIFHIYKGGSSIETLHMVSSSAIEVLHLNDYPANLPNTAITDADRIYPGDGIAPVQRVLQILQDPVKPLVISVEVFNKEYYKRDALEVAKTAFAKTKKLAEGV